AHSNNPISSNIKEIRIIATNANVAFHTIPITSITSLNSTVPTNKAIIAPPHADQPIDKPFGCQITTTMVIKKINEDNKTDEVKTFSPNHQHLIRVPFSSNSFNFSFR